MTKCDRCKKESMSLIGSFFNEDMICMDCKTAEKAHPDYQKARDAERDALLKGNRSFPGIGLPPDLSGQKTSRVIPDLSGTLVDLDNLTHEQKISAVKAYTVYLNHHRNNYYSLAISEITDAEYDRAFDILKLLEKETGFTMAGSPTQTVGYEVVSGLESTTHSIPLLSLKKIKNLAEIVKFVGDRQTMLMLKLDGLTIKLEYEGGQLIRATTRGNGYEGDVVTHNVRAFKNVPATIPYKNRLVITGEAIIKKCDFEVIKATTVGSDGKPYKTPRNLASGSVRLHDANTCAKRNLHFYAFNVLEGFEDGETVVSLEEYGLAIDNNDKWMRLITVGEFGFEICPFRNLNNAVRTSQPPIVSVELLDELMTELINEANEKSFPIDGMVIAYDDIAYSKSLGITGHHPKDGRAYKFEDAFFDTTLRGVEWTVTRSGELSAVAIYDPVVIDGTDCTRATLHNIEFITNLGLKVGDRIKVSKRNMIIPQIEENMDRSCEGSTVFPEKCPSCGGVVSVYPFNGTEPNGQLNCLNPSCPGRKLRQIIHYVSKKAMDIDGLSKETIKKFMDAGIVENEADLYFLKDHEKEIVALDGFGKSSYENLIAAIEASRITTMERFIISMDIPEIGRHASAILCKAFNYDLAAIELAALGSYDFFLLEDFGDVKNKNIHEWFSEESNHMKWGRHAQILNIQRPAQASEAPSDNPFVGKTIVATGKLEHFTRDSINRQIEALGAKAGSSVSKKTDYVIVGEDAGSKATKAAEFGVPILTEAEFIGMAGL